MRLEQRIRQYTPESRNPFLEEGIHPLESICRQFGTQPAVRSTLKPDQGFSFEKSYTQLWEGIQQSAALISQLGLKEGHKVAIVLPMIPEAVEAFWGSMAVAQTALVPLGLPEEEFQQALIQLNPRVLIAPTPFPGANWWDQIEEVRPELPDLKWILQVDLVSAYLGRMERWKAKTVLRRKGKAEPVPGQQMGDFLASRKKFSLEAVGWEGHPWLHWSGTNWLNWSQTEISQQWDAWTQFLVEEESPAQVWVEEVDTPFALWADWFQPFQQGGSLLIPGLVGLAGQAVKDHLRELLADIPQTSSRLNHERWLNWQSGGGFPIERQWLVSRGRSMLSADLWKTTTMGILESPEGIPLALQAEENHTAVWLPYLEKKCSPIEGGEELGRLEIRRDSDEWLVSRQMMLTTEQPTLLGDWEESLVCQEQLVCPGWVEANICSHPAVLSAVVVGKEDPDKGQLPIAYIQLRPDQQAEPRELYEFVKAELPAYMLPRGIRIVDRWPLSAMGSIDRDNLSQRENR